MVYTYQPSWDCTQRLQMWLWTSLSPTAFEEEREKRERENKRGEREQERRERATVEMWLCLLVRSKMTYTFFGRALPRCHAATEERWKLQWWANIHRLWTMDMYMTWNLTLQSSPPKLQAHFTDSLIYKPHGLHIASLLYMIYCSVHRANTL